MPLSPKSFRHYRPRHAKNLPFSDYESDSLDDFDAEELDDNPWDIGTQKKEKQVRDSSALGHDAWRRPQYNSSNYTTNLVDVHTAHYGEHNSGEEKVTLYQHISEPQKGQVHFRWLHVQSGGNPLSAFQDLVAKCPQLSVSLRKRIFAMIRSAEDCGQSGRERHSGSADPFYAGDDKLMLFKAPHLYLEAGGLGPKSVGESILERLHGCALDSHALHARQLLADLSSTHPSRNLRVMNLWVLLARTDASDVLLTSSPLPFGDITDDLISIKPAAATSGSSKLFTAVIINRFSDHKTGTETYSIVVNRSCSFLEFLRKVSLATSLCVSGRRYALQLQDHKPLTGERWLSLLREERNETETLSIVKAGRGRAPSHSPSPRPKLDPSRLIEYNVDDTPREFRGRERYPGLPERRKSWRSALSTSPQGRAVPPSSKNELPNKGFSLPGRERPNRTVTFSISSQTSDSDSEIDIHIRRNETKWTRPTSKDATGSNMERGSHYNYSLRRESISYAGNVSSRAANSRVRSGSIERKSTVYSTDESSDELGDASSSSEEEDTDDDDEDVMETFSKKPQKHDASPGGNTARPTPFFAWATQGTETDEENEHPAQDGHTVMPIFDHIQKSFQSGKYAKLYEERFRCTFRTVMSRIAALTKMEKRGSGEHCSVQALLRQARYFFEAFVPAAADIEEAELTKTYWGAMDELARHIRLHLEKSRTARRDGKNNTWRIRTQTGTRDNSQTYCRSCTTDKMFYSRWQDALAHFHAEHSSCPRHQAGKGRLTDDPCFAWIHRDDDGTQYYAVEARPRVAEDAICSFVRSFSEINRLVRDIQYLIMSPQPCPAAVVGSPTRETRRLPRSLVLAFEEVLRAGALNCRGLSTFHKARVLSVRDEKLASRLFDLADEAMTKAGSLVRKAYRDIIGDAEFRGQDFWTSQKVGASFVTIALITKLQEQAFVPKVGSKATTLVELYDRRMKQLQYRARYHLQRSVFADLSACQEEIHALTSVMFDQAFTLHWFNEISLRRLPPTHSQATSRLASLDTSNYNVDGFRLSLASTTAECRLVWDQWERLQQKKARFAELVDRAQSLRRRAATDLEILNEGHGRAIRVFTIVTLVFLPLSFVTSFLGMNTTDIRDSQYTQTIFWLTSLPVTVLTLACAFLYAYGLAYARDWVRRTFGGNRVNKKRLSVSKEHTIVTADHRAFGKLRDGRAETGLSNLTCSAVV